MMSSGSSFWLQISDPLVVYHIQRIKDVCNLHQCIQAIILYYIENRVREVTRAAMQPHIFLDLYFRICTTLVSLLFGGGPHTHTLDSITLIESNTGSIGWLSFKQTKIKLVLVFCTQQPACSLNFNDS